MVFQVTMVCSTWEWSVEISISCHLLQLLKHSGHNFYFPAEQSSSFAAWYKTSFFSFAAFQGSALNVLFV